ncbi:MAG: type 1 glutamine amidotransferase-like domain-containing protein, partial [Gemmatimonadetes bacterium]|nr:type 1 glutamine amidotransferase-like domain-containing protein [Gemmatimonadota bacterium]NIU61652.1 type 1 glutamine amidotransferase-like domain-containing protein [Stutzerimonas stutzeri]NIW36948.1 type 1 glutamine amidotransferase-like domain-containing protein [Gemmatimonadota bacterium]NIX45019.1 type 1 glutamine amidotransferase-like domain-containing protein [Gemmatimonadota bacterium]NIY09248.1 type 1 glutamine amidotransferase-like domain-containing protein [Gemmatimonadota bacte
TTEVRRPEHLEGLDGLIIPGGESTTIGQVAQRWGLLEPIRAFGQSGRPLWGTCAGMILMAKEVVDGAAGQPLLGLMDVAVRR